MKLYKHQAELVKQNPPKWLLFHSMGSGKTVTSIKLADNNPCPTLVICPKQVERKWNNEIKQWSTHPQNFTVITKEQFRKKWDKIGVYGCIIYDEVQFFGNPQSQLTKAAIAYTEKFEPIYVYLLSGTPYTSSPWCVYSYATLLGRRWNYISFRNKFFYKVKMGNRFVFLPKKKISGDIAVLIRKLGNIVKLEDCVDVPDQVFITEYFDLHKEQKKEIENLTDILSVVQRQKQYQICGGSIKGNEYEKSRKINSPKFKRVIELVKEHKKIAIVCRYNLEIEYLRKEIQKFCSIVVINGMVKDKETEADRVRGLSRVCCLINAKTTSGYELETIPIMVFYSYDDSYLNYEQALGRIQRINNIKKNVYINLVIKDSICEKIYEQITIEKKDFHWVLKKDI